MSETPKVWYGSVSVEPVEEEAQVGFKIVLDGKPVKTRSGQICFAPTAPLARAVADEWRAQTEKVDFRKLPLTGLLFAVYDMVSVHRLTMESELSAYGETDLVCFRAEAPQELQERQEALLDPIRQWAEARLDVTLTCSSGLIAQRQREGTVARCLELVRAHTDFELTALNQLVRRSGSLFLALAVKEGELSPEEGWRRSRIEEDWQILQWGEDSEAAARTAKARAEFLNAARFLDLLGPP